MPPAQLYIERTVDLISLIGLVNVNQADDRIPAPGRIRKGEPDRPPLLRRLYLLHLLKHLDPALDLTRLRGLVSETIDEDLQLFDPFLLVLCSRLHHLLCLSLGNSEPVVVAGIRDQLLTIHLHHAGHKAVHEIPVMGYEEYRD